MLWVGLTGGIGAGKSAASRVLAEQGAALIDADRVAREVVAPGTPGLAAVGREFGRQVLGPDGALDRPALGRLVFADYGARGRLNAIVHPLIGQRTVELAADAERAGAPVLVHDVPLLVENDLAAGYHLVLVVQSPPADRLHRLTALRGMTASDARARIAAQADDADRREVADVVLDNDVDLAALRGRVRELWSGRLVPYADNLHAGRPAGRGPVRLVQPDPDWARAGRRLTERLRLLCGSRSVRVEHVGSTAVPGLAAEDVLDLQVEVASWQDADDLAGPLAEGGFPRREQIDVDPPRPELDPDPAQWAERLHLAADPGRPANVHVRLAGSTSAQAARQLRDLLRADGPARVRYEAERQSAARHPHDADAEGEGALLGRALAAEDSEL